ncbi:MAG: putative collagen-binding domain-containing protein, partial [Candidatus Bathyarchaeia archaeon]
ADDIPYAEEIRRAMGNTRRIARRFNLVEMLPMPDLASTKYCLAKPGYVYVVYLPSGGEVEVDLRSVDGELKVEWMHPVDGSIMSAGTVLGGGWRSFKTPFTGDSVLILYR